MHNLIKKLKNRSIREIMLLILNYVGWNYHRWMPDVLKKRAAPNYGHILNFCILAAKQSVHGLVLDAGAGSQPYKKLFKESVYESTDLTDSNGIHNFTSDLEHIPVENDRYDAILCTEVLEHIKNPYKAISEFYRILKPGGRLFLTVPLQAMFHSVPHHYFNFTEAGLRLLLKENKFKNIQIKANGGAFHFIANHMYIIPAELFLQQVRNGRLVISLLSLPLLLLFHAVAVVSGVLLYYLDFIDTEKYITSGYTCSCQKENLTGLGLE